MSSAQSSSDGLREPVSVDDNGASLTVDGTVTANAGVGPWPITDNGGSVTVDGPLTDAQLRATPVPVSGTVTVTDGSGPLTVDGTVTAAEAKAEDSAAANADAGIPALGVRNDAAAARTSADGDYGFIALDSAGRVGIADLGGSVSVDDNGGSITVDGPLTDAQLRATPVPVSGTVTVTDGSGPITVDGTVTAAEAKAEDSAHASGDTGIPAWGVRNDTNAVRTSADGDYSPVSVDSAGRIKSPSDQAEDAAHASGDTGTFVLGVRNDADAVRTSADGDYSPISTDSAGRVKIGALPGALTGVAEDSAAASGNVGLPVLGVRNDTGAAQTSADGDYGFLALDSAGRAKVNVDVEVASSFTNGQNTDVDTASENLVVGGGSNPAKHGVMVKALAANTGTVYVGVTGVTTATGWPLAAGDHIVLPVDDANKVFVAASVNNQSVAWVAI